MTLRGCLSVEVLEIVKRVTRISNIFAKARKHTIEGDEFFTAYKPEREFHVCIECLRRISRRGGTVDSSLMGCPRTSIEHVVCLALAMFCNCVCPAA